MSGCTVEVSQAVSTPNAAVLRATHTPNGPSVRLIPEQEHCHGDEETSYGNTDHGVGA